MNPNDALEILHNAARQLGMNAENHERVRLAYDTLLPLVSPDVNETTETPS